MCINKFQKKILFLKWYFSVKLWEKNNRFEYPQTQGYSQRLRHLNKNIWSTTHKTLHLYFYLVASASHAFILKSNASVSCVVMVTCHKPAGTAAARSLAWTPPPPPLWDDIIRSTRQLVQQEGWTFSTKISLNNRYVLIESNQKLTLYQDASSVRFCFFFLSPSKFPLSVDSRQLLCVVKC